MKNKSSWKLMNFVICLVKKKIKLSIDCILLGHLNPPTMIDLRNWVNFYTPKSMIYFVLKL